MDDRRRLPAAHDPFASEPAPAGDDSPFVLFQKLHRILRGRYALTASLAVLGALAGGAAGYFSQEPKYQTVGHIHIKPVGEKLIYDSEKSELLPSFPNYVKTQANLLKTHRVIDMAMLSDAWKELGRPYTPEEKEEFLDALNVRTDREDQEWIRVEFTDADARAAQVAVKEVIRSYEEIWGGSEVFENPKLVEILHQKATSLRSDIASRQRSIQAIGAPHGTSDLAPLHESALKELMDLERYASQAELALHEAEASKPQESAQTPIGEVTPELIAQIGQMDPEMGRLLAEQRAVEGRLAQLHAEGFRDKSRSVIAAKGSLESVNRKIELYAEQWRVQQTAPAIAGPSADGNNLGLLSVAQLKAKHEAILAAVKAAQTKIMGLNGDRTRIAELQAEIDRLQAELDEVEDRLTIIDTESKVKNIPEISGRIRIVSYGDQAHSPAIDNRKKFAAAGIVLGGGLPLGIILLIGLFDRRYRYSDETRSGPSRVALLGILPSLPPNLSDPEQAGIAAHCVHQIRTLLQIGGAVHDRRVFAVTSPTAGDGKTSLSLSLGLSFAGSGARTLLIDFDMIGAGLTSALRVQSDQGVLDAIDTGALNGHIVPTAFTNLSILPVGARDAGQVSRLSLGAVRRIIEQAREEYDVVLVDTGPILGSIEASLVAAHADGVVLALGRGQHRHMAERAIEHIHSVGARLLGVVFNRADPGDFRRAVSSASVRSVPVDASSAIVRAAGDGDAMNRLGPMARTVAACRNP